MSGRTVALYGLSGSGKTTQAGEYAKYVFQQARKRTRWFGADMGGYDSIEPLVDVGVVEAPVMFNEGDDPWEWTNRVVSMPIGPEEGLRVIDSGTSISEALMSSCASLAAQGRKVGAQNALRFQLPTGGWIGSNNESNYMVVQMFMLDAIWKSTWLARKGVDVLWTFGEHRAENPNDAPIVGPKLAGKALTGSLPKWLQFTLRLVSIPQEGGPTRHVLHLQEQPELNGLGMSFANARYPIDATTPLPATIEPASISEFWRIIEQGKEEARQRLKEELGLS